MNIHPPIQNLKMMNRKHKTENDSKINIDKIKVLTLYSYLKKSRILNWNKKGEIIYKGKRVNNSNIKNLIQSAILNKDSKPIGFKEFFKAISKMKDIPKSLIINYEGKKIIERQIKNRKIRIRTTVNK